MQRGKEEYKLAATSDGKEKKGKKGKGDKDMDDLKKEVDLVSTQIKGSVSLAQHKSAAVSGRQSAQRALKHSPNMFLT